MNRRSIGRAAPDLLEAAQAALAALENLMEVQQWSKEEGDHIDEAYDAAGKLRVAIAKMKGK